MMHAKKRRGSFKANFKGKSGKYPHGSCYDCGKYGHFKFNFPNKKKA